MNVKKIKIILILSICALPFEIVQADSARKQTAKANRFFSDGAFAEAIEKYDQALADKPEAFEPRYNKANCFYRLEDYSQAIDLYREVSAESKDISLAAKAKYNLGNCYYQQGLKQRDSDLQKAIDQLKASIESWRGAIDIEEENVKAAGNIEVARLMIKDLLDQLKNQQDPNQPSDPNQQQQSQQQQDQQQQKQQQAQSHDPNDPNDNQQQQKNQQQSDDPNDQQKQKQQEQQANQQTDEHKREQQTQDMTAQAILDKEQQEQKAKQRRQRGSRQPVERDW